MPRHAAAPISALITALWAAPAAAGQGVELRAGTLVPAQVLDGANVHLGAGYSLHLSGGLHAHLEVGLQRTTITALTTELASPGGTVVLRADHAMWVVPALVGVGWRGSPGAEPRVSASVGVGAAHTIAELRTSVVDGPDLDSSGDAATQGVARARADFGWPLPLGEIVVGVGWQQIFAADADRGTGDVRASGLFLEAGWRLEL